MLDAYDLFTAQGTRQGPRQPSGADSRLQAVQPTLQQRPQPQAPPVAHSQNDSDRQPVVRQEPGRQGGNVPVRHGAQLGAQPQRTPTLARPLAAPAQTGRSAHLKQPSTTTTLVFKICTSSVRGKSYSTSLVYYN